EAVAPLPPPLDADVREPADRSVEDDDRARAVLPDAVAVLDARERHADGEIVVPVVVEVAGRERGAEIVAGIEGKAGAAEILERPARLDGGRQAVRAAV